jgi:hypothetical protein
LTVRLVGGANAPYAIDPVFLRHAQYTLEFAADYPYWTGPTQTLTYSASQGYLPTTFVGDVESWPKWTFVGPFTNVTGSISTVSGASGLVSQVVIFANITGGGSRIVQMDPYANVVAVRDGSGNDAWADVASRTFAPIPVGTRFYTSVGFTTTGGATATLEYTPAYKQAW